MPKKPCPTFGHLLDQMFAEKGYKSNVASGIRTAVARFEELGFAEFTPDNLAAYHRHRMAAGKAIDTADGECRRIRRFANWLRKQATGEPEPAAQAPPGARLVYYEEPFDKYAKVRNLSPQTMRNMRCALRHAERLGFSKLDTESLAHYREQRMRENVAADTVRHELGKLMSFARWLGETVELNRPYAVQRAPKAWNREELTRLFAAASSSTRFYAHIPGNLWWPALLRTVYSTGERIDAILRVRWCDIDWEGRTLLCTAEIRKGRRADQLHPLDDDCLEALKALRAYLPEPATTRIFGGRSNLSTLYTAFSGLLRDANLPYGRRDKFHRIRRTLATEVHLAGGDATARLGHASDAMTRGHYIDPRAYQQVEPWRPGQPEPDPEAEGQGIKGKGWLGGLFKKTK